MMRRKYATVFNRFFGCKIGDEHAIGTGCRNRCSELFQAHLQNRIVIAEEDQWHLRRFTDAMHEVDD